MKLINTKAASLIKEYRKKKKWSQLDLQKTISPESKNPMQISSIELFRAPIPVKRINNICQAINLPRSILIDAMVEDYRDTLMAQLSILDPNVNKLIANTEAKL